MTYVPTELLTVYLDVGTRQKVGRLAWRNRQILFEYDSAFIGSGIEISPIKLPLRVGVFTPTEMVFDGLFGVFNDSLPDGCLRLSGSSAGARPKIVAQVSVDRKKIIHGRGQLKPGFQHWMTFSYGLAGEQSTMVMGEGQNPDVEHLRALGKKHGLKRAPDILAKVQKAASHWRRHADAAGVSAKSRKGGRRENSHLSGEGRCHPASNSLPG